jgi:hypothetical protein
MPVLLVISPKRQVTAVLTRALKRVVFAAVVTVALAPVQGAAAAETAESSVPDGWSDYQIIMWQPQTAPGYRSLKSVGFTAAALISNRAAPQAFARKNVVSLRRSKMPWYVENIATDFYSSYHRWFPDRPVNWRFVEIEKLYRQNPSDPAAFIRDPSLSDPAWLAKIRDRIREIVVSHRRYQPLFYNLGDEAGIADLNAFWDFDFSPSSLAAMREWLMSQYGTLGALNAEWDSRFLGWDDVVPPTTAKAMRRTDNNFAAWADGKEWMDVAFARAITVGRDAVHAADPTALAGLEGAQKPGWGGYNYVELSHAVDVMEIGLATVNLAHQLNPRLHLLTTSFGDGPADIHRIWRALLAGACGVIIWDKNRQFVDDDGRLGDRGRRAAPYFEDFRRGIGALLINSQEAASPVAILYSPASQRIQWLLDWKDKGDAWLERGADAEDRDDGTVRATMYAYERSLEQLGLAPRYLSSEMIKKGALRGASYKLLVLPHSIALSDSEVKATEDFAAHGGIVIADTMPGLYEEHGRKLAAPGLAALFRSGRAIEVKPGWPPVNNDADPPISLAGDDVARLGAILARFGISPGIRVRDDRHKLPTDIAIHNYHNGRVNLIVLQRDFPATAEQISVQLPHRAYIYDVGAGSFLGHKRYLRLPLDPAVPTILTLSPMPLSRPSLTVPRSAHLGKKVRLVLRLTGPSEHAVHVLHLTVSDPAGQTISDLPSNVIMCHREKVVHLPLPHTAPAGTWAIAAVDVMSGKRTQATFKVVGR